MEAIVIGVWCVTGVILLLKMMPRVIRRIILCYKISRIYDCCVEKELKRRESHEKDLIRQEGGE